MTQDIVLLWHCDGEWKGLLMVCKGGTEVGHEACPQGDTDLTCPRESCETVGHLSGTAGITFSELVTLLLLGIHRYCGHALESSLITQLLQVLNGQFQDVGLLQLAARGVLKGLGHEVPEGVEALTNTGTPLAFQLGLDHPAVLEAPGHRLG